MLRSIHSMRSEGHKDGQHRKGKEKGALEEGERGGGKGGAERRTDSDEGEDGEEKHQRWSGERQDVGLLSGGNPGFDPGFAGPANGEEAC